MIRYLIMDVDGTLTDGKITMGEYAEFSKNFNIKDGYGIYELLPLKDIVPIIFTGRKSTIVENRCKELGIIEVYQGVENKVEELNTFIDKHGITANEVAYIGDDLNDFDVMKTVKKNAGILGCPKDAVKEIIDIADFVSTKDGGDGAVREFIDYLVNL